jgi:hypothetical protein
MLIFREEIKISVWSFVVHRIKAIKLRCMLGFWKKRIFESELSCFSKSTRIILKSMDVQQSGCAHYRKYSPCFWWHMVILKWEHYKSKLWDDNNVGTVFPFWTTLQGTHNVVFKTFKWKQKITLNLCSVCSLELRVNNTQNNYYLMIWEFFFQLRHQALMSQPHFGQVWGWSPTLGKVGGWESSGTPECSELNSRGQNTSHWGVLGVIGKVLKRRYRKCPRIGDSDICSPSYGQKKGRESNW